jgi:glycogen debranching enzyme
VAFLDEATHFESAESELLAPTVVDALEQAKLDLEALRLPRFDSDPRAWTVAAGVPMFVGLYGRDTTMVAWQSAMLGPELLQGTLPALARWQGRADNPWRDEEPGRILHEALTGPLAQLNFTPKARYFGSLTSSALFPLAVAQLWRWTADRGRVAPLVEPALAALRWLDREARLADGRWDGVFYASTARSKEGLQNQTWKDSDDSISWPDGRTVDQPVATCEEQGFVYAAKLAFAEVLAAFGRKDDARRLVREAAALRASFDEAYWMEDAGFYAMALDPKGRQVRSIGSNPMHCLSTGIAPEARSGMLARRLLEPDLFSGWGIRTLSSGHPAYNPYAYHRGSVWPVEHGPLAQGARRFGEHALVERIARAQFEAAARFDYRRLPECFSGHARSDEYPFPSIYAASNAPQAWSAATAVSLVQGLLGLQPHAPTRTLLLDPQLPDWLPTLTVQGLRVGDATVTLRFARGADGKSTFDVESLRGELRVFSHPAPWSLDERPDRDFEDRLGA